MRTGILFPHEHSQAGVAQLISEGAEIASVRDAFYGRTLVIVETAGEVPFQSPAGLKGRPVVLNEAEDDLVTVWCSRAG